jgi:hypothetical protein
MMNVGMVASVVGEMVVLMVVDGKAKLKRDLEDL